MTAKYRFHKLSVVRYAYIDGRTSRLSLVPYHCCPHPGRVLKTRAAEKVRYGDRPPRSEVSTRDLVRWAWQAGWKAKDAELATTRSRPSHSF